MILLLDIGNSRTKWAVLDARGLGASGARAHHNGAEVLPADIPVTPDQVFAANVAGPRVAESLEEAVRSRWNCPLSFARTAEAVGEVRNGYADPQQLGIDRWLAVLAAYELAGGAVCVVDAGTATTVDLVAAGGQHLGGFILPGVDLMLQSLRDGTSDLTGRVDAAGDNAPLAPGTSTGAAMRGGAWLATAGLVEQARALLPDGAALFVTGGRGQQLAAYLDARCDELLVIKGLALSWRAGGAG